ncbi:peptide-methionine (R)-S-oxide reductase MsrB [Oceanisphaera sp.]|uniref:peptide-methionine (R)-S-oxide reductase MsrB n=1 Tax=Oceanisphaera sp. TaxID=1929979 RepID=UPI003A91CB8F
MALIPSAYDLSPPSKEQLEQLAATLSADERRILLNHGTEAPFCGGLLENKQEGSYICKLCALPLFSSACKFESGTGWPSFYAPYHPDHIIELSDVSHSMRRVEIRCKRCDSHMGHVFPDGPAPTGLRYCLNSAALDFCANGEPKPDPLRRGERECL